jgi:hypothetical protein
MILVVPPVGGGSGVSTWQSLVGPAIAILALMFTIGSFWWLQARQGKLRSYPPYSLAAARTPSQALLRFPLVLYNSGAKPIVVQDLRLSFTEKPGLAPLPWRTSRSQLKPDDDDDPRLPAAFSVPGRTAQHHFIEFGINMRNPLPGIDLKGREYVVLIEVLLGHKKRWKRLLTFPLSAKHIELPASYLAYSNTALRPVS